jgi:hypothetical protein
MLPSVFECFGLKTVGSVETAKGLAQIWDYTNWPRRGRRRNVVHKGILYNGTWTAVMDREMNMIIDQEKCEACAAKFKIKIFGYMIESVSGTCALYLYSPEKVRGLNIQNFEIMEDFGDPLPQESGITTEEMLVDGPMRITRRIGFSDTLFSHPSSKVLVVGMEDPMRTQTLEHSTGAFATAGHKGHTAKQTAVATAEKPWWKFW